MFMVVLNRDHRAGSPLLHLHLGFHSRVLDELPKLDKVSLLRSFEYLSMKIYNNYFNNCPGFLHNPCFELFFRDVAAVSESEDLVASDVGHYTLAAEGTGVVVLNPPKKYNHLCIKKR